MIMRSVMDWKLNFISQLNEIKIDQLRTALNWKPLYAFFIWYLHS